MGGVADGRRFTVLSIDGGGVRGIFAAAVLASLERDTGTRIVDHFDLVVGTSTGGIIALGLGAGMRPEEILALYLGNADSIFPAWRRSILARPLSLVRAKYKADGLRRVVQQVFGDTLMCESTVPLVIPSYNIGENAVYLFRTPHHGRLRRDWSVPMWQVAVATTAAPTFFPAYSLPGDHVRLVDGGVWANSPSMVGIVEAVSMFGQPLEQIRLLSLGTTVAAAYRPRRLDRGGLLHWVRSPNVAQVLLAGQSQGAFTASEHLLGRGRAFRLNPPAPESLARLDAADTRDLLASAPITAGTSARRSRQSSPRTSGDRTPPCAPGRKLPYDPILLAGARRASRDRDPPAGYHAGRAQPCRRPVRRGRPVASRALGHGPPRRAGLSPGVDAAGNHHAQLPPGRRDRHRPGGAA